MPSELHAACEILILQSSPIGMVTWNGCGFPPIPTWERLKIVLISGLKSVALPENDWILY